MVNIEKLLEAFSNGLYVRHDPVTKEENGIQSAPYHTHSDIETRDLFKEVLKGHLLDKLSRCGVGESVTYNHFLGTVRNSSTIENQGGSVRSFNLNLQEVMDQLPVLPEGETYVFPANTAVSVKVVGFAKDGAVLKFENASRWIVEAMQ